MSVCESLKKNYKFNISWYLTLEMFMSRKVFGSYIIRRKKTKGRSLKRCDIKPISNVISPWELLNNIPACAYKIFALQFF